MRFAGPGHDIIATVDERGDLLVHRLTQNDTEIECVKEMSFLSGSV
jgi:hypothetical protein